MVALTRRTLLTASATGAALAGTGSLTVPARAAGDAILKPLPPEWFVDHGTNAELRWESVRRQDYLTRPARLFVRNHTKTPVDRPRDLATGPARRRRRHGHLPVARRPPGAPADHDHGDHRVHRQRPVVLRHPAGPTGRGDPVAAGCRGRGHLGGSPARRGPGARRSPSGRRVDHGHRPGPGLRLGRGGLRRRAPTVPGRQGPRRRPPRVGDERCAAVARPRRARAAGAPGLGRDREHQVAGVARGRPDRAHLAVEHQVVPDDRRRLPGRQPATHGQPGALRLGAAVGRGAAGTTPGDPHRPVLERGRAHRPGRRQRRRRAHLGGRPDPPAGAPRGVDPVGLHLAGPAARGVPPDGASHRRRRAYAAAWSPGGTTGATSSTPSCSTRSPSRPSLGPWPCR